MPIASDFSDFDDGAPTLRVGSQLPNRPMKTSGAAPMPLTPAIAQGSHPPAADALVLLEHHITCRCGVSWHSTDYRLFLRKGQHFYPNRLDLIFTRDLPREVKRISFPATHCRACFGGDVVGEMVDGTRATDV